ncbi:MAG: chemotaxis protein CheR [Deltaproteobacteria bacterium]|nr:chemotaxis protein CheR [Deltaproteobacteria bacterium]
MDDRAYADLLSRALPRLGLRFRGFRNVRRQVCRRVAARIAALGLDSPSAYERLLERDPEELRVLDSLCFVTISRFHRDRRIWEALAEPLLPRLLEEASARGDRVLRAWSLGCASGEEPYTLAMLWHIELSSRFPSIALDVLATDRDEEVLARAARGVYEASSLRELPLAWRARAFDHAPDGPSTTLRDDVRAGVRFLRADVRALAEATHEAPIHLVLCRNMAFTYWADAEQRALTERLAARMAPGGLLVLGNHEVLPAPPESLGLEPVRESPYVFRVRRARVTSS